MQIQFVLHIDAEDYKARKYNVQGKEIIKWCEFNHVKLIKDLDCDFTELDCRDRIHVNTFFLIFILLMTKMNGEGDLSVS